MTRLFRSKSCGFPGIAHATESNKAAPSPTIPLDSDAIDHAEEWEVGEDEDKGEPDEKHADVVEGSIRSRGTRKQQGQAAVLPGSRSLACSWKNHIKSHSNYYNYNCQRSGHPDYDGGSKGSSNCSKNQQIMGIGMVDLLMAALRKSLVTCSVEAPEDVNTADSSVVDISWPSEVRHVSHVTFDRFSGFLGLPTELQPHVPKRVPSARSDLDLICFISPLYIFIIFYHPAMFYAR